MNELGAVFRLKVTDVSLRVLEGIKKDLTLKQRGGEKYGFGRGQTIKLYREQGEFIEIPRCYALKYFNQYDDKTTLGAAAPFNFVRQLRPHQVPVIDSFMDRLGKRGAEYGGILCAPCGTGKTIEAINILSRIGRAAIVLVHAEFLMNQWQEALLGGAGKPPFTDLEPADVGRIQQDEEDWQGKTIVLAMVETLINREYGPDFYNHFGVVVADEVHRHAAACWHKAMTQFPARYRIGLSATPSRCLRKDTRVVMEDGSKEGIGDLYESGKRDIRVKSVNLLSGEVEGKDAKVHRIPISRKETLNRVVIQLETGEIREVVCTKNHRFWTGDTYIKAGDLEAGSSVLCLPFPS